MIEASTKSRSGFAVRLARRAQKIAEAKVENALRARRNDSSRWRDARLLWPLFSREA